jgi:phospholipid transport system substrate-binding protein
MVRRLGTAALLALAAATPAAAGEPTETLRQLFDRANQILASPPATDDARLASLRALVSEVFDARGAAALVLGRQWEVLPPAARDEFSRLYADVVESAYLGGLGSRARLREDGVRVAFESEVVDGTQATVLTTLETRGGNPVPVEYRLERRERGWAVIDVLVDGLSLAGSYRAQIQRVLQTGTYADVLARLRANASTATLAAIAAASSAVALTQPSTAPPSIPVVPETITPAAWWIQVGAFRDTEAASRLVERLRAHSVIVATGGDRAAPLARVRVGPFADRAAAASALKELAARGYRAFIAVE